MKVLITTDWYEPVINGVITSVRNLKTGLEQMGHEVKILTLSENMHSYERDNIYYAASLGAGKIYPHARIKMTSVSRYIRQIIEWKPDIVHSQCEFSTFFIAKKIARECGCPLVHTYHTVYEDFTHYFSPSVRFGRSMAAVFSREILNHTDGVIAPTDKIRSLLTGYGVQSDIAVIPSGLNLDRFRNPEEASERSRNRERMGFSENDFVLVFLGRLAREKNIREIIQLLCQQDDPGIRLLIVGDGPYRPELEKETERLGLTGRVVFAGMADPSEVFSYYAMGDVFVSASQSETQGLTYIEAMASGLPILCREDPCLDELIIKGENGFTYSSETEFGDILARLRADDVLRENIAFAARSCAFEEYSLERFAEKVLAEYENVIRKKRNRAA